MDQKILRLPETVINQIAAGEVVEHPASIVKELIENSLDAGASYIAVEILAGGQQLIRVEDDGCGMGPEDARLCLERHATSKIRSVDDLQTLGTMGFRGEALAAIAAVSQFELKTSNGVGTRIAAEGGLVRTVEPCARNRGTTIEICSLFYNVPARKKFQKSAATQAAQVTRVVETIALAHPEVSFSLNGKRKFPATTGRQRIEEILGLYEHEVDGEGVSGFVAAPSQAGSTRTGQYLFINRRPIVSPLIAKAVKVGFGTRIAEHAYPPFILFLEIAPDRVDFNVHPQKKEVRFKEDQAIFRSVQRAVEGAFSAPIVFTEPLTFTPPPLFSFPDSLAPMEWSLQEPAPELTLSFPDHPLAVFGPYLLLQKEHLLVADLRAVHARILFESLQKGESHSQALLWPLEISIHPGEEGIVEAWNRIGIESRLLGRKSVAIDALPSSLEAAHLPLFLESWRENKEIDRMTHSFCRRLPKQYSLAEATTLWRQLRQCRDQTYDPLGNPLWTTLREETFEKLLKHG